MGSLVEVAAILLLILLNGVLSLSEIAIVSARKARLQRLAQEGNAGARTALELANAPNHLLSTVQLGITLVGVLAGAFGGATLADNVAASIAQVPALARYAQPLAMGLVVLAITYLSIVLGELVPKRLALNHPESIASAVAGAMARFSRLASPAVFLLSRSTELMLRLLGVRPSSEPPVTDEEIELLLAQGAQAGVFEPEEATIVRSVLHLADQRVAAIMTPRTDIHWVDVDTPDEELRRVITESPRSRLPVAEGSLDRVVGIVRTRDLLAAAVAGQPLDARSAMHRPLFVPETMPALTLLERMKQSGENMALVVDEYGMLQGLVTLTDVLEAIVGTVPFPDEKPDPTAIQRDDGSWLVDGLLPIHRFEELLPFRDLPAEGAYHTVGGLVLAQLGRIPAVGDHFILQNHRFEVVDMDDNRVDKVLVTPLPERRPRA